MSSLADLRSLLVTLLCAVGACAGVGTLVAWLVLKANNAEVASGGGGPSWDEIKHQVLIERQLNRR
jgi:hypothetical protein